MATSGNRLNGVRLVQGQTKMFAVGVKTREGRPAQLGGAQMYMSVRRTQGAPVLIRKSMEDGIVITDPSKGEVTITLSSSDTIQLEPGDYRYDVWVEFDGTPPVRFPVISYAEIRVEDSMTEFT